MAYWIQETNVGNNSACRSYLCDFRTDIDSLPRVGVKGQEQTGDSVSSQPCACGSDCMVLEDSSVWILGKETNTWMEI